MKELLNKFLIWLLSNEKVLKYIKVIFKYSFIIWFAIIGYILYQFFMEFRVVKLKEKELLKVYRTKKGVLTKQRKKLTNIETSYQTLRNIFTSDQVKQIKDELNKEIELIYNQLLSKNLLSITPYRIEQFNIKIKYKTFTNIPSVSLADIEFSSDINKYYGDYLKKLYEKSEINKKKFLKVKLKSKNNYLILYASYTQDPSILAGYRVKSEGFIRNVFKYPAFLTASILPGIGNYSNLYFGWLFELQEEVEQ
jgi:hypothetical protein